MTTINLLPWRERQREERKKQFIFTMVASAMGALVVMVFSHFIIVSLITNQEGINNRLEQEIVIYNQKIQQISEIKKVRANLIARMRIIELLQANRNQIVHVFDEIINVLPKGVYLEKVSRKIGNITMSGFAESNTNVSDLMRSVDVSEWLQQPRLSEIREPDKSAENLLNEFSMDLLLKDDFSVMQANAKGDGSG